MDPNSRRNESPMCLQFQAEEAAGPDVVTGVEGGALDTMARYVRRCLGTMKPPGVSGVGIALPRDPWPGEVRSNPLGDHLVTWKD